MTSVEQPNDQSTQTSPPLATASSSSTSAANAEIDSTLSRLSAYRNVRGVMVLTRQPTSQQGLEASHSTTSTTTSAAGAGAGAGAGGGIVQSTGSVFEGESGQRYARALEGVVNTVGRAVGECDEGDELKFMRIRTKRHELIVTPDDRYILVVLQDPGQ